MDAFIANYFVHCMYVLLSLCHPLQIYSKYAEVSDELIKEREAKELVQNQLNYLIQVSYMHTISIYIFNRIAQH